MIVVNLMGAKNCFSTHQQMASKIVEVIRDHGFCTQHDIERSALFSEEEIEECWPMALSLAQVELMWLDA